MGRLWISEINCSFKISYRLLHVHYEPLLTPSLNIGNSISPSFFPLSLSELFSFFVIFLLRNTKYDIKIIIYNFRITQHFTYLKHPAFLFDICRTDNNKLTFSHIQTLTQSTEYIRDLSPCSVTK